MSEIQSEARELLKAARITLAIAGVIALIVGIVILVWPVKTAFFITGLVAAYLIVAGLVYLGLGIFSKEKSGWSRIGHIVLGLLYIAAGIAAFVNLPVATIALFVFLGVLVGVSWIVDGIVALSLLGDAASKAWTVFYAIISILGGIVVLFAPLYGELILWWILGVSLVLLGILQIIRSFTLGGTVKKIAAEVREISAE